MLNDGPLMKSLDFLNLGSANGVHLSLGQNQRIVGSGKSGISLYLSFLSKSGFLRNRFDEVFCPPWMGSWVYSTMTEFAYPSLTHSSNTKVIHMYHQFGFLQDIDEILNFAQDKKLAVLEDSAHLLGIEGLKLNFGIEGSFSVFSPPKFIPSLPIGIVQSSNSEFLDYVDAAKNQTRGLGAFSNALTRVRVDHRLSKSSSKSLEYVRNTQRIASKLYSTYPYIPNETKFARAQLNQLIPEYSLRALRLEKLYNAIPIEFLPKINSRYTEKVPFKVPVQINSTQFNVLAKSSFQKEANFGQVHFDFNQNMVKPLYKKAVCIRIQGGVSDSQFEMQISEIKKALSVH